MSNSLTPVQKDFGAKSNSCNWEDVRVSIGGIEGGGGQLGEMVGKGGGV